ncbi:MAG: mycofactocin biosynthesis peptidyl-dipeptidase MftE [Acidimicrobiales bacterium]
MHVRLGELTWPDLADAASGPTLVAVPLGSCEQHGPHLPLDTDTRVAVALAEALASHLPRDLVRVVVAPPVAIAASGEHAGFPGTLSIGTEVTELVLVELVRSADWADGVVLVNGHGGNASAVARAAERSRRDGRRVLPWWPRIPDGDAHAGRTETSLLLHLAPELVRRSLAEPGRVEPVRDLIDDLRAHGTRHVSPNGVLGDPTGASAEAGAELFDALVADLCTATRDWWTAESGRDR